LGEGKGYLMFFRIFLLFTTVTLLELALIIEVGRYLGVITTIFFILFTAVVGAYLAQTQGLNILNRIQFELQQGRLPSDELLEGLLVLVGGILLLTPGFLTDALGFLCILPFPRYWLREKLKKYFRQRLKFEIY